MAMTRPSAQNAVKTAPPEAGERDFRRLFDAHPTPMWVYDPETLGFLAVNAAAVRLYGHPRAAYDTMTVLDIRPESERARMLEAVKDRSDIGAEERWQHLRANGELIDVVTQGHEVKFNGVAAILAIVTDRSEVTRAYRQASDTRSLLDSIVANLPIGVFVKDMADDGRYLLYNEACGEIVGHPTGSILGRTDLAVFPSEQGELFRIQDRAAMTETGTLAVEELFARPDGDVRIVRTVKRAIPTLDGSPPRYLLGLSEDVTVRRSHEAEIAHVAMHDALTGLPNRAFFAEHVARLVDTSWSRQFALLYIDVDHFKHINDSMGHPAGDAFLQEAARRLRRLVRPRDFVARLGGDEFAVTMMLEGGADEDGARACAERVMSAFDEPFDLEGAKEHVNASVGVALAPRDGVDVTLLLRNADLALYAAKEDGRSTFRVYQRSMRLRAEMRHDMTLELRRAVRDSEFELHYQPIVSLADDTIVGCEALVRWRHPERGMIAPAEFITVAEETGLIGAIGDWVLREACRTAATWPDDIKVAVNLSPCQFQQVGLLATVVAALGDAALLPSRLEVEITETVLLAESRQNLQLLHALRELGVRIAIDDFGTGYSSLSYLRSFPFDKIKMDRSFVAGIESDPGSLAIARAVMGLGAGFKMTTTAEGVETPSQLRRLRNERFDEAQGYLIAKPMPAADVAAFIASWPRSRPQARTIGA